MKNRFRIKKEGSIVSKCDTMEQVIAFLRLPENEYESLYAECVVDDIEVSGDEILAAFNAGEAPGDLQFF